jgi:aspartate/methionine/tyrosine aminotransferase
MKVLIDKAERLWKMPRPALGSMHFIQRRLNARGVKIIDLESLLPEIPEIASLSTEIPKLSFGPLNPPANAEQIARLKAKIIEKHQALRGLAVDADKEMTIIPGVRMAAAIISLALLNTGDVAAYPDPGVQFYRTAICLADGNPRRYQLLESNDYMLNISSLPGPSKKTKMIFLNYPHNPTGAAVDYYFYRDLLKSVKFENVLIVADCAHVHPGNTEAVIPLQAKNARRKTLELHSFSTTFGAHGLGFAVGHKDVISILDNVLNAVGFAPDSGKVNWALACLDHAEEIFIARMDILQRRQIVLAEGLKKLGWRIRENKYLPFIWAKIPYRSTSVAFARRLFAKAGVRVAPGSDFGEGGEGWLRLSLCCNEGILNEALERLALHSRIWQRKFRPEP